LRIRLALVAVLLAGKGATTTVELKELRDPLHP
jgi:hypothetical protein